MIERKKEKYGKTGRGEAHIPGALHCRSSTCFFIIPFSESKSQSNLKMGDLGPRFFVYAYTDR